MDCEGSSYLPITWTREEVEIRGQERACERSRAPLDVSVRMPSPEQTAITLFLNTIPFMRLASFNYLLFSCFGDWRTCRPILQNWRPDTGVFPEDIASGGFFGRAVVLAQSHKPRLPVEFGSSAPGGASHHSYPALTLAAAEPGTSRHHLGGAAGCFEWTD